MTCIIRTGLDRSFALKWKYDYPGCVLYNNNEYVFSGGYRSDYDVPTINTKNTIKLYVILRRTRND